MHLTRKIKNYLKKIFRCFAEISQRFGIDILPHHYYSEIPDFKELRLETYWKSPSSMIGINGSDIEEQLDFIKEICNKDLVTRLKRNNIYSYACFQNNEPGFGPIESDFLFCFIHNIKPKRIIQIGCGVSTAVIMLANKESNFCSEIICIDAYPTKFLQKISNEGRIRLISEKVQKIDLNLLTNLDSKDLLFIDSTHTVKPGSDVNRIILEVLPRSRKGVYAHFQDIYFPYDYKRNLLSDGLFFSNESVLLHAFLINNSNYKINISLSMLHYSRTKELKEFLPNYNPQLNNYGLKLNTREGLHFPSSTYLRAVN